MPIVAGPVTRSDLQKIIPKAVDVLRAIENAYYELLPTLEGLDDATFARTVFKKLPKVNIGRVHVKGPTGLVPVFVRMAPIHPDPNRPTVGGNAILKSIAFQVKEGAPKAYDIYGIVSLFMLGILDLSDSRERPPPQILVEVLEHELVHIQDGLFEPKARAALIAHERTSHVKGGGSSAENFGQHVFNALEKRLEESGKRFISTPSKYDTIEKKAMFLGPQIAQEAWFQDLRRRYRLAEKEAAALLFNVLSHGDFAHIFFGVPKDSSAYFRKKSELRAHATGVFYEMSQALDGGLCGPAELLPDRPDSGKCIAAAFETHSPTYQTLKDEISERELHELRYRVTRELARLFFNKPDPLANRQRTLAKQQKVLAAERRGR